MVDTAQHRLEPGPLILAGGRTTVEHAQEVDDLVEGKAERLHVFHQPNPGHGVLRVDPVARGTTPRRREDAAAFIETDRVDSDTRALGHRSDAQIFAHVIETTLTLDQVQDSDSRA